MAKLYDAIDERLQAFIAEQPMFFVATAPDSGGHVNVSPKGYQDTFSVIDENTVAYLDLYGSGSETIAHLRDNGRITVMFCSFSRQPKILRLYGTGRVVRPDAAEWDDLAGRFGAGHAGYRAIVVVDVTRVSDSCGYSIPFMELTGERSLLDDQHARRPSDEWVPRVARNASSIDGLPALEPDHPAPVRPLPRALPRVSGPAGA
ncbi:pyridoxamine 5'-phosphate oxidase [Actinoallomurus bryophytorum]|uniref:Pyridoxamine 5'-phosphate oxidase n=1 Tax=Actinoallomurus bryophytorum TaxID=1490222 RepID=A0A543CRA6_9ACTN|nr:pyridoxamine 5'-phosphate oxidase family protein [Actinoallomurus bryophytorum]TQL99645.1 pyridoxamine 5'-phosphate oxidase [Actinoallomurus bryophytorum]